MTIFILLGFYLIVYVANSTLNNVFYLHSCNEPPAYPSGTSPTISYSYTPPDTTYECGPGTTYNTLWTNSLYVYELANSKNYSITITFNLTNTSDCLIKFRYACRNDSSYQTSGALIKFNNVLIDVLFPVDKNISIYSAYLSNRGIVGDNTLTIAGIDAPSHFNDGLGLTIADIAIYCG